MDERYLLDLLLKIMYRNSLELVSDMAKAICLPPALVEKLIELGKTAKLIEPLGQLGASLSAAMRYALTAKGKVWAVEALSQSEWAGPCPVTLEAFHAQAKNQSIRAKTLTQPVLESVFSKLTLADHLMEQLGPAVNSGASMLLYGPPGNGKSSIATALCEAFRDHVYLPHAIAVDSQVIALFDPTVHTPADVETRMDIGLRRGGAEFDTRFVVCERPRVETGGELTLDMLDLAYNPVSHVYEAPMQMKASGGVLVIDDFGRQRQSPQDLINRLIIPLEKNVDYLSLMTGRKFEVPYDALTIFSTNIPPKQLVDEAALRRLRYKILVGQPDRDTYLKIFAKTARSFDIQLSEEALEFILFELYAKTPGAEFHAFHPRFLIDQTRAICAYQAVAPELRPEFLEKAWKNLFTDE
ncbi:AAA family ATPase [Rhodobacteraceae bacterium NNCM2]|nr:AAA family ATPase [Coraliihabitans acroporae]